MAIGNDDHPYLSVCIERGQECDEVADLLFPGEQPPESFSRGRRVLRRGFLTHEPDRTGAAYAGVTLRFICHK
jgi:hypothetical protein